ncbi:unnamed protein product [Amoebophrya sp. A25]|nr:unnamed protein product [Amoebophrya sp. A25]|eukprot:GSA25T00006432001.1
MARRPASFSGYSWCLLFWYQLLLWEQQTAFAANPPSAPSSDDEDLREALRRSTEDVDGPPRDHRGVDGDGDSDGGNADHTARPAPGRNNPVPARGPRELLSVLNLLRQTQAALHTLPEAARNAVRPTAERGGDATTPAAGGGDSNAAAGKQAAAKPPAGNRLAVGGKEAPPPPPKPKAPKPRHADQDNRQETAFPPSQRGENMWQNFEGALSPKQVFERDQPDDNSFRPANPSWNDAKVTYFSFKDPILYTWLFFDADDGEWRWIEGATPQRPGRSLEEALHNRGTCFSRESVQHILRGAEPKDPFVRLPISRGDFVDCTELKEEVTDILSGDLVYHDDGRVLRDMRTERSIALRNKRRLEVLDYYKQMMTTCAALLAVYAFLYVVLFVVIGRKACCKSQEDPDVVAEAKRFKGFTNDGYREPNVQFGQDESTYAHSYEVESEAEDEEAQNSVTCRHLGDSATCNGVNQNESSLLQNDAATLRALVFGERLPPHEKPSVQPSLSCSGTTYGTTSGTSKFASAGTTGKVVGGAKGHDEQPPAVQNSMGQADGEPEPEGEEPEGQEEMALLVTNQNLKNQGLGVQEKMNASASTPGALGQNQQFSGAFVPPGQQHGTASLPRPYPSNVAGEGLPRGPGGFGYTLRASPYDNLPDRVIKSLEQQERERLASFRVQAKQPLCRSKTFCAVFWMIIAFLVLTSATYITGWIAWRARDLRLSISDPEIGNGRISPAANAQLPYGVDLLDLDARTRRRRLN